MNSFDSTIKTLGACTYRSPIQHVKYVSDDDRILADISEKSFVAAKEGNIQPVFIELAGPREKIFFDPVQTRAAIVTCGGLCPGLNNVIRSIVMALVGSSSCGRGTCSAYTNQFSKAGGTPSKTLPCLNFQCVLRFSLIGRHGHQ